MFYLNVNKIFVIVHCSCESGNTLICGSSMGDIASDVTARLHGAKFHGCIHVGYLVDTCTRLR